MAKMYKPNVAETQKFNRMSRILELLHAVKIAREKDTAIDIEKLIAIYGMKWGTSRRTMLEYINVLQKSDKVLIVDNEITLK